LGFISFARVKLRKDIWLQEATKCRTILTLRGFGIGLATHYDACTDEAHVAGQSLAREIPDYGLSADLWSNPTEC